MNKECNYPLIRIGNLRKITAVVHTIQRKPGIKEGYHSLDDTWKKQVKRVKLYKVSKINRNKKGEKSLNFPGFFL